MYLRSMNSFVKAIICIVRQFINIYLQISVKCELNIKDDLVAYQAISHENRHVPLAYILKKDTPRTVP